FFLYLTALTVLLPYAFPVFPALVPRHPRLDPLRPGVDAAGQAPHLAEARSLQDFQRLHRSGTVVAVGDDLTVSVQLAQAVGQLAQRDQPSTVDMADLPLVRLPDVDEDEIVP